MIHLVYEIINKYIGNSGIIAFDVVDDNGKNLKISFDTACELAKKGSIKGFKLIEYRNNRWLKGNGDKSLNDVPNKKINPEYKYKAIEAVKSNGKTVGFKVCRDDGKELKLSNYKIWELSRDGSMSNIRATISLDEKLKTIEIIETEEV